jgi:predicted NBD/HSP70 family sugar kinase
VIASGTWIGEAGKRVGLENSRAVLPLRPKGTPKPKNVLDRALEAIANATWTVLQTFMPERIILGGGIMHEHYDLFAPMVRGKFPKPSSRQTPIFHWPRPPWATTLESLGLRGCPACSLSRAKKKRRRNFFRWRFVKIKVNVFAR